jgi:hypothetical protein
MTSLEWKGIKAKGRVESKKDLNGINESKKEEVRRD